MYNAEDGLALFGLPLYIQMQRTFAQNFVEDSNANIVPTLVTFWQAWLDK